MNNHAALPTSTKYVCRDCNLIGPRPMVLPVANPINDNHGRCSNRKACERRQRRVANKAKAAKS